MLSVLLPAPRLMESAEVNSPAANEMVSLPALPTYVKVVVASVAKLMAPVEPEASIVTVAAKSVVPKVTAPAPVMFTFVAPVAAVEVFVKAVAAAMLTVVVIVAGPVKAATLFAAVVEAIFKVVAAAPVTVKAVGVPEPW